MENYQPTSPQLWQGRTDRPEDVRWHQRVQLLQLDSLSQQLFPNAAAFIGFCCDEGVRRNKGRTGAAAAPDGLRKAMASFAWHFAEDFQLLDVGNIYCLDGWMENSQQQLSYGIEQIIRSNAFPVVLGGGHETAFASYSGLRQAVGLSPKIGIINFDAHFDLRLPEEQSNSGTPFYQISQLCEAQNIPFHYLCLGINPAANTASLFERAKELGVQFLTNLECATLSDASLYETLQTFIEQQDLIYLTIDLDGFDAAFAPGVSAPAVMGLLPQRVMPLLQRIASSGKLALVDVCELNPTYDVDGRTAKLGAFLLYQLLSTACYVKSY